MPSASSGLLTLISAAGEDQARDSSFLPGLLGNFFNIAREYLSSSLADLISGRSQEPPQRAFPRPTIPTTTTTTTMAPTTTEEMIEEMPTPEALLDQRPFIQKIEPRSSMISAEENSIEENLSAPEGETTEILDAFFDLDSDDIFYNGTGSQSIQHPRLLQLIRSSLAKYRSQSDMGLLKNLTPGERNRIRILYMVRPIFGVLRRKSENSKIREKLKEMEAMLDEIQEASILRRVRSARRQRLKRHIENKLNEIDSDFDGKEEDQEVKDDEYLDDDDGKSELDFDDAFGILFVMELIGTVAGLAFGAFSQLSKFLTDG